jgi:hypothetical protein
MMLDNYLVLKLFIQDRPKFVEEHRVLEDGHQKH